MKKSSKKKKSGAIESSGVPSSTPVGLRGQVKVAAGPVQSNPMPKLGGSPPPKAGFSRSGKKLT